MSRTNPKVDVYLKNAEQWRGELTKLRAILLGCGLDEDFKWGKPCYTFEEANVAVLLPLKAYCSLLLTKGALLKDPKRILVQPGENSQSARQVRFTSAGEITKLQTVLKAYLKEAIAAEKAGLKVKFKSIEERAVPVEFQEKLDRIPALKKAYEALTPGRRRGYLMLFSSAKQSETRRARVDKCMPAILAGKGLNDD